MAKLFALIATLSLLSLFSIAYSQETLFVTGQVYCDTCRALFVTHVSEFMENAKVKLICRDQDNINNVTVTLDATTDVAGTYAFKVDGDHEDEVCEVFLEESPVADCNEKIPGLDRARILVTENNGITSGARFVNALGFLRKDLIPECTEVLKSYELPATAHV